MLSDVLGELVFVSLKAAISQNDGLAAERDRTLRGVSFDADAALAFHDQPAGFAPTANLA